MGKDKVHSDTRTEAPEASSPVISVENLHKTYGDIHAVNGVNLQIVKGEIFGLLGPNGAGKTTLVEILEGHFGHTSGSVQVLGMEPMAAGRSVRDRLGIVPQQAGFEVNLTVYEHLATFAGYYSRAFDVDELLELVDLTSKRNARVGRLSGGQQRRLDLAIALVGDPDIVFLDEPTTGLDIHARTRAWDTVSAMRGIGKTVFLTTHNMVEAQHLCDRVAVMNEGQIAAIGKPDELLPDQYGGTIAFKNSQITLKDLPLTLAAQGRSSSDQIVLNVQDTPDSLHELLNWARKSEIKLESLEVRRPDLEDLYLSILAEQANAADPKGSHS